MIGRSRLGFLVAAVFAASLLAGCTTTQSPQVATEHQARMDSTLLYLDTELTDVAGAPTSGLDELRLSWRARCPGRQSQCKASGLSVHLIFVGGEFAYSRDTQLEIWHSPPEKTGHVKLWSGYVTGSYEEVGGRMVGQRLEYRVPIETLERAAYEKIKIGVRGEEEGNWFTYTLSSKERAALQDLLKRVS